MNSIAEVRTAYSKALRDTAGKVARTVKAGGPFGFATALRFQQWASFLSAIDNRSEAQTALEKNGLSSSQINYVMDFKVTEKTVA